MNTQKLSPVIKNLMPGLTELGKIKIGRKGNMKTSSGGKEFQPPQKLDHFVVTTLERDETGNFIKDEEIHKMLGDKPTRIPILLVFDDITLNFQSRYACFKGRTAFCSGDGEHAIKQDTPELIPCPCPLADPQSDTKTPCKMHGILSVMIQGAEKFGGVWKFRTTSYNSIQGITSSLCAIQRMVGGPIAGLPLELVLSNKTAITPKTGEATKIQIVSVEYPGSMEQLREQGIKVLSASVNHRRQLALIEAQAKEILTPDIDSFDPEEFHPDQVEGMTPVEQDTPAPEQPEAPDTEPSEPVTEQPEPVAPAGTKQPAQPETKPPAQTETKTPVLDLF